ncbi:helix-turn-helix domain-containing protein [Halomicrobium urmianum]|uniref:helix-turn-helix domain-containing protein n=1 Tax=Halomicrobium urmianum TaxID=1586233 RepID=UPI001CD951E8|nr:helix-turn-helix domain-containing protein [Halomicrobium urmianum]
MPVKLTDADEAILDMLSRGRCTVGYLADETDYSRQHVHNRLNVLLAAEYVRKVHDATGLYELRSDPQSDG